MEKTTTFQPYILACTLILLLQKHQLSCQSSSSDASSLLTLKAHFTNLGPHHILTSNWTNSSSVCSWIGVTCSLRHRRVTALDISGMGLEGDIPPYLGNLSFLVSLDLSYNLFHGVLPQELSRLTRLTFISIRNNTFTGSIPETLANLSRLENLDFSSNFLQGGIPSEFGRFRSLRVLYIQYNGLSGSIPSSLFNISTLESMAFTSNELTGGLPACLCCNLPFLEGIYLSSNQLSGQIPSNLSGCSQLRNVSLSFNSFGGEIPKGIGMLKSLQMLYVGTNNLNGVIPREIGNLQNLIQLDIGKNQIIGEVPLALFTIFSLQSLRVSSNRLTGNLPREIGNLTMLKRLNMGNNNFTGIVPQEIGKLHLLEELTMDGNSFTTTTIPPEFFNISTLRILSLTDSGLSGSLPVNLGAALPLLKALYLSGNNFSGPIPDSMSNCSQLRQLSLGNNKFTGFVPYFFGNLRLLERLDLSFNNLRVDVKSSSSELSFITTLTNCRSLYHLAIDDNPLDGVIPASVGNFSAIFQGFFASICGIKGTIPEEIGNLSNLVSLGLGNNELFGNIPLSIRHFHNLQAISLESNKMGGSIPEGFCHLSHLNGLYLRGNQFFGQIPECLGNVTSLRHLFLDSNKLTSSIPSRLFQLNGLLRLDLSSNSLSGVLPQEIGNLVATIYINLSMNQLSGYIPNTVGDLQNVISLSLAHNEMEGFIPASIGNMISLVTLDLSYNNLSGLIPKSLEELKQLDNFNVSFNSLTGEIPTGGPFMNFTTDSFKANAALCGIQKFGVPPCHIVSKHKSRRKKVHLALFVLSGVVAFSVAACLVFFLVRYSRKHKTVVTRTDGFVPIIPERISYYELLQATEQFSESNLLGTGSFGSVYRGIHKDGKIFAVKVFNLQSQSAFKSFDVECEVLRSIRHRNLIKVWSSCSNDNFRALVLEHMPNGDLEKWLYSYDCCLDVEQRLNIMVDVASALEYLHHGYSTPIAHCDLKPSNVLLDEEMVAHVSDFGIAKLLGEEESISHTNTLATLGYIAPEYGLEGLVSTRCDVYSFGIMLMETFTRKRPSDDMFAGNLSLKSWIESSISESSIRSIMDDNLMPLEKEHFNENVEWVSSVFRLALKCSAESPKDRMNMKEVVAELQKIKRQFLATKEMWNRYQYSIVASQIGTESGFSDK